MAKLSETINGVKKILDAANERFNGLLEQSGIEPDDPRLTADDEEEEGAEGQEGGEDETASVEDENQIPQADGGEGIPPVEGGEGGQIPPEVAAQAAEQGAVAPTEIPPEATQIPPEALAAQGGAEATQPSPDEDEQLKAAQAAQQG